MIMCMAMVGTFWFLGCNKTSFEKDPLNVPQEDEKTLPKPTDGTTPADHEAIENYYIATGVLREAGSFVGQTTGTSVSLGINQDIYASRTVLGKDVFKESYSFGVKKVGMQFYVSGKNYVMRDTSSLAAVDSPNWDKSTPYKVSEETFAGKFGGKPLGICNYIVKDETTTGTYLGVEDGLHAFRYDFDIKTATPKMLLEMKTMSGMDSTFTRAAIIVYMDNDWVVKKTTTDCEYVVSYGMLTPSCTESITEVFSALGEGTPLPHGDVFGPYLEAEVTDPIEKEPTALDYIMSGFGAYMAGTPLVATIEADGIVNLRGAASVNIDINELSNIKARVKIDELSYRGIMLRDLFVAYSDDTVYIKYADLKAKGTVTDATALVKKLTALIATPTDGENASGGDLFGDLDASALLDSMTLVRENGVATVGITIPLGDVTITATLEFTDGDTIVFTAAHASIAGKDGAVMLTAVVKPVESAFVPEIDDTYYDVIPLVNELIDNDGNICVKAVVGVDGVLGAPITLNAKVNLATLRVDASGTIGTNPNELRVRFDKTANSVYIAFGALKASFNLEDIPAIKDKFAGLTSATETTETEPSSTLDIIKDILGKLTVTETDGKLTIALKYNDLNASVTLNENGEAFGFGNISASYGKLNITATAGNPESVKTIEDTELKEFKNIVPVLDVIDDNLAINLHAVISVNAGSVTLENIPVDLSVDLKTLTVMAKATIFEKDIFVKYADDTVYVSALGINAKASKDDIASIVDKFKTIFATDDTTANAMSGLLESLDLDNILASLKATATENGDGVILGGEVSVNDILVSLGITLGADDSSYNFGGVNVSVKNNDTEIVTASVVSVDGSTLDFSPLADAAKFYNLKPLIDQLIDNDGNIKLKVSIDTDVTDAIGDAISGAITEITDGKTEIETAEKKPIVVTATLNLKTMRLTANVLGINLLVDLKTTTLYAECGGAKVLLECGENFGAVKSILQKLAPTIRVFAPDFDPNAEVSIDFMATAEKLVKALESKTDENGVTLSLQLGADDNTVNVSVRLNANETDYGFGGAVVAMGGTKITISTTACVTPAPDVFAADGSIKETRELKANGYVDLSEVADKFADTLNSIFTAKNLEVTLGEGCAVTLNGTTISLSGNIKVAGVNKNYNDGVIKVNANLKITIAKDGGTAKTYGLTVIYVTPKAGDHYTETTNADNTVTRTVNKPNAYFKLDRLSGDASTGKPIIGTFSTANVKETMDILKTIYNNMPELQGALSFLIPESADGKFHMPSIENVGALVDSLTFDKDNGVLGASLTVASLIHDEDMKKKMSDPIALTLSADEGGAVGKLGVTVGLTMKDANGNASTTVALNGTALNVEDFPADTFAYNANENTARTSDFTSINDLLRALAKTSENRHFEMSANIELQIIGSWKVSMDLSAVVDVEGKDTYVAATLTRKDFTGSGIVYSDYGGTTDLYYYGEKDNEMFYVHNHYCTRRKFGLISAKYSDEYIKYTKEEFTNNLMDIMLKDILHFSSTVTNQIDKADGSKDISVEDVFTKYSYTKDGNGNNVFNIDISLDTLTGGTIKAVPLTITSDASDNFKTVYTKLDISILNATINANLTKYAKESQNIKAGMPTPDNATYKWSSYHA